MIFVKYAFEFSNFGSINREKNRIIIKNLKLFIS